MKIKLFHIGLLSLIIGNNPFVFSQSPCTPNTIYTQPGIYPDSATGLPPAYTGTTYSTVVDLKVKTDTTLPVVGLVYFDSVKVMSVTGLDSIPSHSFMYQCNTSTCSWVGGANGCVLFSGNPVMADTGIYSLVVIVRAYVRPANTAFSPFYQDIPDDDYKIIIEPPLGMPHLDISKFDVAQNVPNPFTGKTEIIFSTPTLAKIQFTVYNILGKLVFNKSIDSERGINKIIFNSSRSIGTPGIYFYKVSNGNTTITKRMMITN